MILLKIATETQKTLSKSNFVAFHMSLLKTATETKKTDSETATETQKHN